MLTWKPKTTLTSYNPTWHKPLLGEIWLNEANAIYKMEYNYNAVIMLIITAQH